MQITAFMVNCIVLYIMPHAYIDFSILSVIRYALTVSLTSLQASSAGANGNLDGARSKRNVSLGLFVAMLHACRNCWISNYPGVVFWILLASIPTDAVVVAFSFNVYSYLICTINTLLDNTM